ncbi:hypothetical protein EJB05_14763, partial [Eragrostis curvula]
MIRLLNGGFVLALRLNHTVCDAIGVVQFISAVGKLDWRRELLDAVVVPSGDAVASGVQPVAEATNGHLKELIHSDDALRRLVICRGLGLSRRRFDFLPPAIPLSIPCGMDCPKRMMAAAGLPDDSLVEILSRLPVKPLHRSKCVARSWRDLIDDPSNRKKLAQTLEGFFLMEREDGDDGRHFGFVNLPARSVPLDIDPCFSFLTSLPGIETLNSLDSCNGLLLFEHRRKTKLRHVLGYIVCNPATKEWGTVPTCDCPPPNFGYYKCCTYLVFDPAVSPHFHLVQLREESVTPHAYSSETGTWSHIQIGRNVQQEQGHLEVWSYQGLMMNRNPWRAFVNGMLHFIVNYPANVVAVDVQGKTQRIIPVPNVTGVVPGYVAQSQGCLHYIHESVHCEALSIWVLKDYGTHKWVLLDTLNFLELFGTKSYIVGGKIELRFVAIHPDRNVVFLAQISKRQLMSYDMDSKQVNVIGTHDGNLNWPTDIVPYVPNFSKSPVFKCEAV